jgi:hypothetical protein
MLHSTCRKISLWVFTEAAPTGGEMILGLLFKIKKKHALALQHLTEAKRILSPFGKSPMLAQLEMALGELGQ